MKQYNLSRSTIASASLILAFTAFLSKILGLLRDRLLASHFGTGATLDAYQISFLLPDFIYNLFIVGALSAAFIPIFLEVYQKRKKQAWNLVAELVGLLSIVIILILFVSYIFTPQIVNLLGKLAQSAGTRYNAGDLYLIIKLTRIMLIAPLLLGFSALFTGVLQSFKHFLMPAIAPIFYNLGIIGGILFLTPFWGIYGVAFGVLVGSFLHLAIQLPSLITAGFRFKPKWGFSKEVRRVIKLAIPRTFGLVAQQAGFWINKIIAFTLGVGAVSVYYFANNLQFLPISLFGVSIATATFPDLASFSNGRGKRQFVQTLTRSFCQIIYLTVPVSVIFLLLRAQIVRLVLGTGEFDWSSTIKTAATLGFFSISIFAQSLILLLARAFFALKDTKTPVIVSVISLLINIVLSVFLSKRIGVAGLSLAFSIASFLDMLALLIILRLKLESLDDAKIIKCGLKVLLATILMGGAVYGSLYLIAPLVDMHRFWGVLVQALGATIIGVATYFFLTLLLKCAEIKLILEKIKKINVRSNQQSL